MTLSWKIYSNSVLVDAIKRNTSGISLYRRADVFPIHYVLWFNPSKGAWVYIDKKHQQYPMSSHYSLS